MIISASYKTDIPAFYGEWFMNRLRAGYCKMVNPYGGQVYRVSLAPQDADGFVFWTKNLGPFLGALEEVRERGYPFVVQYTINGYPRELERAVVDPGRSAAHMRMLAADYGPRVAVWRYDTIVYSSLTDSDFHRRNFEELARRLEGTTDEVVVSFAQIYRKTERNLNRAGREYKFNWTDPADEEKLRLLEELAPMARARGMQLSVCSQRKYLLPGVADARCVDAERLSGVAGRPIAARLKGNRPDCGCYQSRDIGEYNTCPHGCVYCYAVSSERVAGLRFGRHDPVGELLSAARGD
jgi:transposase